MKTIRQANRNLPCGYDLGHRIAIGEKYLEITGVGPARVRCAACALRHGVRVDESSIVDAAAESLPPPAPPPVADVAPEPEPEPEFEGDPW